MSDEKIDIIIPCYNACNTLPRLLGSIIAQKIVEDIEVTLVNDCDEQDYRDIIDNFKKYIPIKEVKLDKNSGPGTARRVGYENSSNPFVAWADADDTFGNTFSLELLREHLTKDPTIQVCAGSFIEEGKQANHYSIHRGDIIWMHGKLYRRSFLDKYNIRMNDTRANEDNGFNKLAYWMCSDENEKFKFLNEVVYFWLNNPKSITYQDDYSLERSFDGYVENMIWAINEAESRKTNNIPTAKGAVQVLISLYRMLIKTKYLKPYRFKTNLEMSKKYYKEGYSKVEYCITDEIFESMYKEIINHPTVKQEIEKYPPTMALQEFMDVIKYS